jgi:hypothetical protein
MMDVRCHGLRRASLNALTSAVWLAGVGPYEGVGSMVRASLRDRRADDKMSDVEPATTMNVDDVLGER